jgi:hypothetical protein
MTSLFYIKYWKQSKEGFQQPPNYFLFFFCLFTSFSSQVSVYTSYGWQKWWRIRVMIVEMLNSDAGHDSPLKAKPFLFFASLKKTMRCNVWLTIALSLYSVSFRQTLLSKEQYKRILIYSSQYIYFLAKLHNKNPL